MNGWSDEGAHADSPMPKSVSLLWKGKNSIVDGVMITYLSWWDYLVFIVDDHDDFPFWMMIWHLPNWAGDRLFLISNWILEDN